MEHARTLPARAAQEDALLAATTDIISSYLLNHRVEFAEVERLIERVHGTLERLSRAPAKAARSGARAAAAAPVKAACLPSVAVRESVTPEYIVCLEDGKKLKVLKRYLRTQYNLTPAQYRARWGLPEDYPMVAPNYSKRRQSIAKTMGLGRKQVRAAVAQ
jgi:predicted transcriptional regulator